MIPSALNSGIRAYFLFCTHVNSQVCQTSNIKFTWILVSEHVPHFSGAKSPVA
nr:MAG TPA: hypothetical protein [Bacteriophage sp.]